MLWRIVVPGCANRKKGKSRFISCFHTKIKILCQEAGLLKLITAIDYRGLLKLTFELYK